MFTGHDVFFYTYVWYDFFHSQMDGSVRVCVCVGGVIFVQGNLE